MENNLIKAASILNTSKAERMVTVAEAIDTILDGHRDPLEFHIAIKCMEEMIKNILDDANYKAAVLSEAEKFGKSSERHNAKIAIKETGVKYEFSQCGDEVMNDLMQRKSELDAAIKSRSEFLKSLPAPIELVTEEGIVNKIYPPSKSSTTSVTITLK